MDVDPSKNTVIFEFKRWLSTDTAIAQVPTRSDDGIERAWRLASAEKRIKATRVRRIFSEWQPSNGDSVFIRKTFTNVEVGFSFSRPDSADGWNKALADAQRMMMEAMSEEMLDGAKARQEARKTQLLPVLRDFSRGDVFAE